jgi:hypothetical protein
MTHGVKPGVHVRRASPRPGLLILAALIALVWATPAAAQSFVPAHSARTFGDSIGVNVRLTYIDTPAYRDFSPIESRLRELGVRYVSDSVCATCQYQIDRLQRLAADGIKANLGVGWIAGGTPTIGPGLQALRTRLRDSIASISGLNEPDISGNSQWIAVTRAYQAELYRQAKADPFLARFPVLGPSLVNRGSRAALGDLSAYLDRGNLHPYPGGLPPLGNLPDESQLMSYVSGAKPLVISEVGYHTDLTYTGPHRPASEQAVAIYTPRIALEAFHYGIERTYIYQFADLMSEADAQSNGLSPSQNSFGLLRSDLSPKPSFLALRNLLRVVDGDSAPVAAAGGMRLAVEGAGPDVRQLLLQSADGSYALVLWRSVSVWDRTALRDLAPAPDHVEVALGQPVTLARRFDPVASDAETHRWIDPTRIPIDLGGAPVVLKLVPPGAASGRVGGTRGLRAGGGRAGTSCVASVPASGSTRASRRKARARCCQPARHSSSHKARKRKRSRRAGRRRMSANWTSPCVSAGRRQPHR